MTATEVLTILEFLQKNTAILVAVVILAIILLFFFAVLLIVLRRQLLPILSMILPSFLKWKFGTVDHAVWKKYDMERRSGYVFRGNLVIADSVEFQKDIELIINHHRGKKEPVTFSFVWTGLINAAMIRGFQDAINNAITANNVKVTIVFPCSDRNETLTGLKFWLRQRIAQTGTKSVIIREDTPTTQVQLLKRLEGDY